jgi:hypothetical protein
MNIKDVKNRLIVYRELTPCVLAEIHDFLTHKLKKNKQMKYLYMLAAVAVKCHWRNTKRQQLGCR